METLTQASNKENTHQIFQWTTGNLDEYRARIRAQFNPNNVEPHRHERQLTEIHNLQNILKATTPKKEHPTSKKLSKGNDTSCIIQPSTRSVLNKSRQSLSASALNTCRSTNANRLLAPTLASQGRALAVKSSQNQNKNQPKTPKRDVPDFQRRFQVLHEKEQQRLTKFQQGRRKSTKPSEFNLSSSQQRVNTSSTRSSNRSMNDSRVSLSRQSSGSSKSMNHPAQPHLEFEADPSALQSILNSHYDERTNRVEEVNHDARRATTNGHLLNSCQKSADVNQSFSADNSRLSLRNTLGSCSRPSLGLPQRVKKTVKPTLSRVGTNSLLSSDQFGMSTEMKKQYQDIIKSASKESAIKKRNINATDFSHARDLFADGGFGSSTTSNANVNTSMIVSGTVVSDESMTNHLRFSMGGAMDKRIMTPHSSRRKSDHIENFSHFLTPSTKKLLSRSVAAEQAVSTNLASANPVYNSNATQATSSSSLYDMEDDPELTNLIYRITTQSPVRMTPVRVLSSSIRPTKPIFNEESGATQPYYDSGKMDITPHDRTGAENPISKILSDRTLRTSSEYVMGDHPSVKRILDFYSFNEPNENDSQRFNYAPTMFRSLDFSYEDGTEEVHPSEFNHGDSMLTSP